MTPRTRCGRSPSLTPWCHPLLLSWPRHSHQQSSHRYPSVGRAFRTCSGCTSNLPPTHRTQASMLVAMAPRVALSSRLPTTAQPLLGWCLTTMARPWTLKSSSTHRTYCAPSILTPAPSSAGGSMMAPTMSWRTLMCRPLPGATIEAVLLRLQLSPTWAPPTRECRKSVTFFFQTLQLAVMS